MVGEVVQDNLETLHIAHKQVDIEVNNCYILREEADF